MRRVTQWIVVKAVFTISLLCLCLQIMLSTTPERSYKDRVIEKKIILERRPNIVSMRHRQLSPFSKLDTFVSKSEREVLPVSFAGTSVQTTVQLSIKDIKKAIQRYNDAQTIYNEDIFGPVTNDTVIIAIQVHRRTTYLNHLIKSLSEAQGINRTLLIFSHDYFEEEINNLVRSIDFTKVLQIFYPFSTQTHPDVFPGMDPNDCPRDAKYADAIKLKCKNALHPDVHGHYREAMYPQIKHHWWWKANRIFNQLNCTNGHTGMVLFLEEDHYVAEDFLYMLSLLKKKADSRCPYCEILSLGTYDSIKWRLNAKVQVLPWHSSIHNMGFAFNSSVWSTIMVSADKFCHYDDYNWDLSLLYLSRNRPGRENFKTIQCKVPRVFHVGECGFHHRTNCSTVKAISKLQVKLQNGVDYMYPADVIVSFTLGKPEHNKPLKVGNGGWGDIRDRELCMKMTRNGREQTQKNIEYEIESLDAHDNSQITETLVTNYLHDANQTSL